MTGGGWTSMTLKRSNRRIHSLALLLISCNGILLSVSAQAATATATLTLGARFIAPPCTIVVPKQISLGDIRLGSRVYPPFAVEINCTTASRSILYAEPASGERLVGGFTSRIEMTGSTSSGGTPAQFWLNTGNKEVDLTGTGATDLYSGFCEGIDSRNCTLTPATKVVIDTPKGLASATIRISIRYP